MTDTSKDAVERLAEALEVIYIDLANDHAWSIDCHDGAATLRALLAERDALHAALQGCVAAMEAMKGDELTAAEAARLWNASITAAEAAIGEPF